MIFKNKIRILPLFIFMAALTLSFRMTRIVGDINKAGRTEFSLAASHAYAEENSSPETAALSTALEKSGAVALSPSDKGNTFSQSEITILQELAARREALDIRSKEIDKKAVQLKVAEEEIAKKLEQLQAYEKKLRDLMREYTAKEKEKLNALVKLYTTMKPRDAARIFNTLDLELTTALLREMKPSSSSAIISLMDASKAKAITNELIGNSLTNIEDSE